MKGFEVDPRDRAAVRQHLPAELISLVDNAEAKAAAKIDEIVDDFTARVQAKIEELAERDFAAELQEAVDKEQKATIDELSKSADGLAAKIQSINDAAAAAAAADDAFRQALDELSEAQQGLQNKLDETSERFAQLGSTAGKVAKGVISKFLGGIF